MGGKVSSNKEMVDSLIDRDDGHLIKSARVEGAFRAVDRAMYFEIEKDDDTTNPYEENPWRRGNLHLSAPQIYASVVEALDLHPGMSFLNMGSGTGYLNTIVGLLIGPNGLNHGIELHKDVVDYAYERLEQFKRNSCAIDKYDFAEPTFVSGNCLNLDPNVKYDRVYLGASCLPDVLTFMMKLVKPNGGIIVMPFEDKLMRHKRVGESEWRSVKLMSVFFTTMIGLNQYGGGNGNNNEAGNGDDVHHQQQQQQHNQGNIIKIPRGPVRDLKDLCRVNIRQQLRRYTEIMHPRLLDSDTFKRRTARRHKAMHRIELQCQRLARATHSTNHSHRLRKCTRKHRARERERANDEADVSSSSDDDDYDVRRPRSSGHNGDGGGGSSSSDDNDGNNGDGHGDDDDGLADWNLPWRSLSRRFIDRPLGGASSALPFRAITLNDILLGQPHLSDLMRYRADPGESDDNRADPRVPENPAGRFAMSSSDESESSSELDIDMVLFAGGSGADSAADDAREALAADNAAQEPEEQEEEEEEDAEPEEEDVRIDRRDPQLALHETWLDLLSQRRGSTPSSSDDDELDELSRAVYSSLGSYRLYHGGLSSDSSSSASSPPARPPPQVAGGTQRVDLPSSRDSEFLSSDARSSAHATASSQQVAPQRSRSTKTRPPPRPNQTNESPNTCTNGDSPVDQTLRRSGADVTTRQAPSSSVRSCERGREQVTRYEVTLLACELQLENSGDDAGAAADDDEVANVTLDTRAMECAVPHTSGVEAAACRAHHQDHRRQQQQQQQRQPRSTSPVSLVQHAAPSAQQQYSDSASSSSTNCPSSSSTTTTTTTATTPAADLARQQHYRHHHHRRHHHYHDSNQIQPPLDRKRKRRSSASSSSSSSLGESSSSQVASSMLAARQHQDASAAATSYSPSGPSHSAMTAIDNHEKRAAATERRSCRKHLCCRHRPADANERATCKSGLTGAAAAAGSTQAFRAVDGGTSVAVDVDGTRSTLTTRVIMLNDNALLGDVDDDEELSGERGELLLNHRPQRDSANAICDSTARRPGDDNNAALELQRRQQQQQTARQDKRLARITVPARPDASANNDNNAAAAAGPSPTSAAKTRICSRVSGGRCDWHSAPAEVCTSNSTRSGQDDQRAPHIRDCGPHRHHHHNHKHRHHHRQHCNRHSSGHCHRRLHCRRKCASDKHQCRHRERQRRRLQLQQLQQMRPPTSSLDRLREMQRGRRRVERRLRSILIDQPDQAAASRTQRASGGSRERPRRARPMSECEKYRSHLSEHIRGLPLPRVLHRYLNYERDF